MTPPACALDPSPPSPSPPPLQAYADANSVAQQALGNIRTVYAFNGDRKTVETYDACLEEPMRVGGW